MHFPSHTTSVSILIVSVFFTEIIITKTLWSYHPPPGARERLGDLLTQPPPPTPAEIVRAAFNETFYMLRDRLSSCCPVSCDRSIGGNALVLGNALVTAEAMGLTEYVLHSLQANDCRVCLVREWARLMCGVVVV